jgi:soluble lytic murein transglycosylase-like protein
MRSKWVVASVALWVAIALLAFVLGVNRVGAQGGGYEDAIYAACAQYGCDGATLTRVAGCESGFNPNAVGPHGEIGLFQFMESTYYAYGGTDIWNPYEQIQIAAQMWAGGLGFHWVCQ